MVKRALSRKNLWERLPTGVKARLGIVLDKVPQSMLLGRRFRHWLGFAKSADRWPADRSRAYQLEQLRFICKLAYEKSPFYRDTMKQAGFEPGDLKAPEDLSGLPTIDKNTVREHLDRMCTVSPSGGGIDYVSTGGSSGEPLRFYMSSDRSAIEYAYLVASWQRVGYDLNVAQAVLRGQIIKAPDGEMHHEYDPVLRRHYYSNFHTSDHDLERYVNHMRTIGPFYLHVYPSSVAMLARFMERTGTPAPENLRGVLAGSERVEMQERQKIEQVLGVRYFSWYGHSEKLVLAAQCEHAYDAHVYPTYGYFELIDEDGVPLTEPGQDGEIVGTGFINKVVPFIRYRTDDRATYAGNRCEACGREHPIIRNIRGRWPQGQLITRDGGAITMTTLNVHDDTFENVTDYQFLQDTAGEAVLRVVAARPLSDDEKQRILSRMNKRLQGQVRLTLEVCKKLEKTQRGKIKRVIQSSVEQ